MPWEGVRTLVESAKSGDKHASESLYALAQPYLLGLAQKLLGPSWPNKSISDLIQETWLRAWQFIRDFKGADNDADTAALFRAWLSRMMKNIRLNDIRFDNAKCRQHPAGLVSLAQASPDGVSHSAIDPPGSDPTPSQNLRNKEQLLLLEEAIKKLPNPSDGEILRFRFFHGLSFCEIGERLKRDESTIRYRLQQILDILGSELRELL